MDDHLQLEGGIQEAGEDIVAIDGEWVDRREAPTREKKVADVVVLSELQ